jgi:BCD family chlorophyll transporter-like MFS transporter
MWLKVLRLIALRFASAWTLILLTLNFNRIAIVELQAVAVVVTTLLALQFFLSPLQAVFGRLSDQRPLAGYHRTLYMVLAAAVLSLAFPLLPGVAIQLGERSFGGMLYGTIIFLIIAAAVALYNANGLALIADLLDQRARDRFAPLIIMSGGIFGIIIALTTGAIMPVYTPERMQLLYNLTPLVMLGSLVVGLLGLEPRGVARPAGANAIPAINGPGILHVLANNAQARIFVLTLFMINLGIFLQDAILEPFGGEIFAMTPQETAQLQAPLGGGLLLGAIVISLISLARPLSKKGVMYGGGALVIVALGMLVSVALRSDPGLLPILLLIFGFGVGMLQMGWFSLQVEMTIPGQAGLLLGLWSAGQYLGNGFANVTSGALHTGLIETGFMAPTAAYAFIFSLQLLLMAAAMILLRQVKPAEFHAQESGRIQLTAAMVDG